MAAGDQLRDALRPRHVLPVLPRHGRLHGRDLEPRDVESLDVYLAPISGKEIYYRFKAGLHPEARWHATSGFIANAMDPRHGKDDVGWNGDWTCESRVDPKSKRWTARLKVPFKTLGLEASTPGAHWSGSFGRVLTQAATAPPQRSAWSAMAGRENMDDRHAFGEMTLSPERPEAARFLWNQGARCNLSKLWALPVRLVSASRLLVRQEQGYWGSGSSFGS